MNIEAFKETIRKRAAIEEASQGEWVEGIERCWKAEQEILSEDIPSTVAYFKDECTSEEFSWISEIIVDLIEQTRSASLMKSYEELAARYPSECEKYNIGWCLEETRKVFEEHNAQ